RPPTRERRGNRRWIRPFGETGSPTRASVAVMAPLPQPTGQHQVVTPPSTLVDLYHDRYDPMVRLAYLLVADRAVAEELVQDAFVKVHRHWAHIEHPKAYLRTTVVNTCRSWGRRRTRERDHERRRLEAVPDPDL